MSKTITREYEYLRNGKKVIIRRQYSINGTRNLKNEELDEYFKNNIDFIKNTNLNNVLEEYNKNHDNKISYSLLYQKFKKLFGYRKNHTTEKPQQKQFTECQLKKQIKKEMKQKEEQQRDNINRLRDKAAQRKKQEETKDEETPQGVEAQSAEEDRAPAQQEE